eukprot:8963422-Pyramimonas_sp.AAC.1
MTLRQLRKSQKRRAAPPWSFPVELHLMAADPKYLSVGPEEHLGLGCAPIGEATMTTSAHILEDLHVACRMIGRTPILGNLAWAIPIAKFNGKVGTLSKRLIN